MCLPFKSYSSALERLKASLYKVHSYKKAYKAEVNSLHTELDVMYKYKYKCVV